MTTSRNEFLAQLERCVKYQNQTIAPPVDLPMARDEWVNTPEFIPEEPMGNGAQVHTDSSAIWGLRPPGEESPETPYIGDWA